METCQGPLYFGPISSFFRYPPRAFKCVKIPVLFSHDSQFHSVGHHLFTMSVPVCQGVFRAIVGEFMKYVSSTKVH
jgi:hypothetical protein